MVYDLRTTSKQAKQRERLRKKERKRDGETHREICDRGDGDERRMSAGKKREETECRSGLERLLHEGGLGSTANYA